jgi:hypothetical protein
MAAERLEQNDLPQLFGKPGKGPATPPPGDGHGHGHGEPSDGEPPPGIARPEEGEPKRPATSDDGQPKRTIPGHMIPGRHGIPGVGKQPPR